MKYVIFRSMRITIVDKESSNREAKVRQEIANLLQNMKWNDPVNEEKKG